MVWDIWFNEHTRQWECTCDFYRYHGDCPHLTFYRRITDVDVKEEYL